MDILVYIRVIHTITMDMVILHMVIITGVGGVLGVMEADGVDEVVDEVIDADGVDVVVVDGEDKKMIYIMRRTF